MWLTEKGLSMVLMEFLLHVICGLFCLNIVIKQLNLFASNINTT